MLETIIKEGITIPIGTHEGKRIVLASDHRGFGLKKTLLAHLSLLGYATLDVGTYNNQRCDYPDYAVKLGKEVSENYLNTIGIAICGSGIGMSIVTGKFRFVYPARCLTKEDAILSRIHNNSNVLVLSESVAGADYIMFKWLTTPFYQGVVDEQYLIRYIKTVKMEEIVFCVRSK